MTLQSAQPDPRIKRKTSSGRVLEDGSVHQAEHGSGEPGQAGRRTEGPGEPEGSLGRNTYLQRGRRPLGTQKPVLTRPGAQKWL